MIMRRHTAAVAAAALAAAFALAGCATLGGPGGGGNVPHLTLQDVDGRPHRLTDYVGRKPLVLMSFWATWCMPCRQELGVLQELFERHAAEGLAVLAINADSPETLARVRPFVRQSGWTFTVLLDSETRATMLYNPRKQLPCLHIFDAEGRIVYTSTSFQPAQAGALRAKVRQLLERPGGG